ncbi:MAG: hypothetical protein U1F43_08650 [Myxococcota bacterium]
MSRFPSTILRILALLVVLTTTPGVSDLVESTVHSVVAGADGATHHGPCSDEAGAPCSPGCTHGLFHTCHCAQPPYAPAPDSGALTGPSVVSVTPAPAAVNGGPRRGHPSPLFKPPSA